MATETRLTEFRPSLHGWAFDNFGKFGNCGGMCWSALDCFYRRQAIDRNLTTPSKALRETISGRQKDSLDDWIWAKSVDWTQRPDLGHRLRKHSVGHLTQAEEWPKIKNLLIHGEPATLCVIREEGYTADPTNNHQVVAWGYEYDPARKHVSVRVYDPNHHDEDRMTLEIALGRPQSNIGGRQTLAGQRLNYRMRGFFLIPYDKDVNVHIHQMTAAGTVGERIDQRTWHKGWTQAQPYMVRGAPYLFLLKRGDGSVHIHRLNHDGRVGSRVNRDDSWTGGWTSAEFFSVGGTTFLFLLKERGYGSDKKNVHIHRMNSDGTVGKRVPKGSYKWTQGWTTAHFFSVGGVTFLFLLKEKGYGSDKKNVHIHRMNSDGTVGDRVPRGSYKWTQGWTTAHFFSVGGVTFLFLLKEKGYGSDKKNVHIHRMNSDGTVGGRVPRGSRKWSEGWSHAKPYVVGGSSYLFLLKERDGVVHVHKLNSDGTVGTRLKDYNWTKGWTTVEFYTVPSGTHLLLLKETQKADSFLDIPFV